MTLRELCSTCGSDYLPVRVWLPTKNGECLCIERHQRMGDLLRLEYGDNLDREVDNFIVSNSPKGLVWHVILVREGV